MYLVGAQMCTCSEIASMMSSSGSGMEMGSASSGDEMLINVTGVLFSPIYCAILACDE